MSVEVERHRTAIRRAEPSRPIRLAISDNLITSDSTVFDYGCGHGDDIRHLLQMGIQGFGWDPAHSPRSEKKTLRGLVTPILRPATSSTCSSPTRQPYRAFVSALSTVIEPT